MSTSKIETSLLYFVECFIKDNTKNVHLSSPCSLIQVQFEEKNIQEKYYILARLFLFNIIYSDCVCRFTKFNFIIVYYYV